MQCDNPVVTLFSKKILIKLLLHMVFSSHQWSLQDIIQLLQDPLHINTFLDSLLYHHKHIIPTAATTLTRAKYSRQHNFQFNTWLKNWCLLLPKRQLLKLFANQVHLQHYRHIGLTFHVIDKPEINMPPSPLEEKSTTNSPKA